MSTLVWIHKFNANELGLGNRGAFCLVPIEARKIFFPDRDFIIDPILEGDEVSLVFAETEEAFLLTYSNPPSKTEHRLSLANGLTQYVGQIGSGSTIEPNKIGLFYRKGNSVFLAIADENSAFDRLLQQFPSRGRTTNLVTEATFSGSTDFSKVVTSNIEHVLPKPFLLLAGISGTGKTRFIRKQAEASGSISDTYCLTPVRPDWHEPSDLLGYTSRLGSKSEYVITDVLQFIAKAWRAIFDASLTIQPENIDGQGDRLVVSGESEMLNSVLPYWLCLDEMNLAPVEQYFADYLSILETREWHWNDDNFTYFSDPLLKIEIIIKEVDSNQLRTTLGFESEQYENLWLLISKYGLGIPFNLIVAGTVNMDETTHGFSRKVIDRALSFDFGDFFPNDYAQFFEPKTKNKTLTYPIWSQAKPEYLSGTIDPHGQKSIDFLAAVNDVLTNTPFQLAYRALNELLLAVASSSPKDDEELKAVWDDFLMCKVLPRLEGDHDKLGNNPSILERLEEKLKALFSDEFWNAETARPDLFRVNTDDSTIDIPCRSKAKLAWMQARLTNVGYTSFWP